MAEPNRGPHPRPTPTRQTAASGTSGGEQPYGPHVDQERAIETEQRPEPHPIHQRGAPAQHGHGSGQELPGRQRAGRRPRPACGARALYRRSAVQGVSGSF
ncbi:hypothetical protein BOQ63_003305 (plasmid) [Streptomyces viridifaciens]|nr:hypothetical protein BOQ63_003305 [Streptomyces viridifaciens]